MKKTIIFLPKFLYAAIFIFVVFGPVWFPVDGAMAANQNLAAGGGSASGVAPSNGVAGRAGAEGKNEPLSNKSDIHQQANNQYQGVSDRGLDVNIFQINSRYSGIHLNYSSNQVASINDIIPKVEFIVNKRNLRVFDPFNELGIIKNTPNQPAAKLISNSEMTERKVGMFSNAITRNYTSSTLRSEVYPTEKISAAGRGGAAQLAINQEQGESNRQQAGANISAVDKFVNLFQSHDFIDPENDSTFSGWLSMLAPRVYAGVFLKEGRITII